MPDNTRFCGQAGRAKLSQPLLLALLALSLSSWALARTGGASINDFDYQGRGSGGGSTVFGDFKVDDSKVIGPKPETFTVILYTLTNAVVARDTPS